MALRRVFTAVVAQLLAGRDSGDCFQRVPSSESTRVARVSLPSDAAGEGEYGVGEDSAGESSVNECSAKDCDGNAYSANEYYLKVFCYRSMADVLKQLVRGSRARRSRVAAEQLLAVGLQTPPVIDHGAGLGHSWLVTRRVAGVALGLYLDSFLRGRLSAARLRWKWRVIEALGKTVGRMHSAGIVHGDLRLNNVLIASHAPTPVLYFVDNERNKRFRALPPRALLVKNLVQLNLMNPRYGSRGDRLRFLRAWLAACPRIERADLPALLREVSEQSRQRQQKLERKGPPAGAPLETRLQKTSEKTLGDKDSNVPD